MEKHTLHVSIIGGGIGGLTAASALQRQGIQVTVFEHNTELREIGAGLTLWANGVQVLRRLGLSDALAAVSARLTHFECRSWRGKRLGSMRLDSIQRRVGAPSVGIHCADLLRILAEAVARESIHVQARCVGFRTEQRATEQVCFAHFADGRGLQTDLLVGAECLFWYRARGGGWVVSRGGDARGNRNAKANLLRLFAGWQEPIEQLISATDEGAILRNDIFDRRPVRHWGRGRVTLLGDAAHPPTPTSAKGRVRPWKTPLFWHGVSPTSASRWLPCALMKHTV